MSREEIVAILGEPETTLHGVYLNFASRGVQLVLVGREPDRLGTIIANPWDAGSLTRHDFSGQTDKGVRIGSSESEVRQKYGVPDANRRPGTLAYDSVGISFGLVDDKVAQIIVVRPPLARAEAEAQKLEDSQGSSE